MNSTRPPSPRASPTSTLADFYSATTSGIGTLRGPLHGGANEEAMALIQRFKTPDEAEAGLMAMLEKKELIMGFWPSRL